MAELYKRSPLTEAVVEFRLEEPLSPDVLDKACARLVSPQFLKEDISESVFEFGPGTAPRQTHQLHGYKLTAINAGEVIQVKLNALGVSKLPPYGGWDEYREFVSSCWTTWRKATGRKRLSRIGVRYLNRIDIPCPPGTLVETDAYLAFNMNVPKVLDAPRRGNYLQINSGIAADGLQVNLMCASTEPALIDHIAVGLDIDVFRDIDVPQQDDDIWALLDTIRKRRTEIFEACITDQTRALIR
jgi:uncharacterized protein (TIGR04255 family)